MPSRPNSNIVAGLLAGFVIPALGMAHAHAQSAAASSNVTRGSVHMPESVRETLETVIIVPGQVTEEQISGTYQKDAAGVLGGISKGSRAGSPSAEIGGVTISFPIPILTIPGAIFGGFAGKAQEELQDFRDDLTDDLASADNATLYNEGLALDVYWGAQKVDGLDSRLFSPTTPVPEDTQAILSVEITNFTIDVDKNDAILATTATATLRMLGNQTPVYRRYVQYQDRDTLKNWTRDDNALWRDYANFARHYLGRDVADQVFRRVELRHNLSPTASSSLQPVRKSDWHATTETTTPTLAWNLELLGGNAYGEWADAIKPAQVSYELEIYDRHKLVYSQSDIPSASHRVFYPLECKNYRWTVRPIYRAGNKVRTGDWMRKVSESTEANQLVGRKASDAPAYVQDFAALNVDCD